MVKKRIRKADIILIAVLLLLAAAAWAVVEMTKEPGGKAVVVLDEVEIMELSLSEDTEVLIGEGDDTNLLVIKDGRASITEASCPDEICVKTGEIGFNGETIVCLPHKMVVRIDGGEPSEFDTEVQ